MNVWLRLHDRAVLDLLRKAMPGVRIVDWEPVHVEVGVALIEDRFPVHILRREAEVVRLDPEVVAICGVGREMQRDGRNGTIRRHGPDAVLRMILRPGHDGSHNCGSQK